MAIATTELYILVDSDVQDEDQPETCVAKEHRRYAHSAAEQKRRDAIRVLLSNNRCMCLSMSALKSHSLK